MGYTDLMVSYTNSIIDSFLSPDFDRMSYDWVVTSLLNYQ